MGHLLRRACVWCIAALAFLVTAAPASAVTPVAGPLRVTLLDAKQAGVLARGAVRVRVAAPKPGRYKVSVRAGRRHVATRTVVLRRAQRPVLVRFRLSAAGRRTMASCRTRAITARAVRGKTKAFVTSTYVLDPKRCKSAAGAPKNPQVLSASSDSSVSGSSTTTTTTTTTTGGGGSKGGGGGNGGGAEPGYTGYQVGIARASTDPPAGQRLCLAGYGSCPNGGGRTMTGIKDPMFARAMAVSQGKDGFLIVHTTNIGFFATYKTEGLGSYYVRQDIARQTGLRADHILVQADHSHSSPDTIGIWGGVPVDWLRLLQKQAIAAGVDAWRKREPATIWAGTADGKGVTSSYKYEPNLSTDDEFRMLWAERDNGTRIATMSNYSPHATVMKSSNTLATGDWPEWASYLAEAEYGGGGIGGVATLGREDFGANEKAIGGREGDAKARLKRMMADATKAAKPVPLAGGVKVKTTFLREIMAQPVLLLNLLPEGALSTSPLAKNPTGQNPPESGYDISIDRGFMPPFLTGNVAGTYAGAVRIGDLFFGFNPGEAFPQIQQYLRDDGAVKGPRIHFMLGAVNDFLGYMVYPLGAYPQVTQEGATYLGGCPEGAVIGNPEFVKATGFPYDAACTDHWTLQVSPTIGTHVACTIQAAGLTVGFRATKTDPACPAKIADDDQAGPKEEGA